MILPILFPAILNYSEPESRKVYMLRGIYSAPLHAGLAEIIIIIMNIEMFKYSHLITSMKIYNHEIHDYDYSLKIMNSYYGHVTLRYKYHYIYICMQWYFICNLLLILCTH